MTDFSYYTPIISKLSNLHDYYTIKLYNDNEPLIINLNSSLHKYFDGSSRTQNTQSTTSKYTFKQVSNQINYNCCVEIIFTDKVLGCDDVQIYESANNYRGNNQRDSPKSSESPINLKMFLKLSIEYECDRCTDCLVKCSNCNKFHKRNSRCRKDKEHHLYKYQNMCVCGNIIKTKNKIPSAKSYGYYYKNSGRYLSKNNKSVDGFTNAQIYYIDVFNTGFDCIKNLLDEPMNKLNEHSNILGASANQYNTHKYIKKGIDDVNLPMIEIKVSLTLLNYLLKNAYRKFKANTTVTCQYDYVSICDLCSNYIGRNIEECSYCTKNICGGCVSKIYNVNSKFRTNRMYECPFCTHFNESIGLYCSNMYKYRRSFSRKLSEEAMSDYKIIMKNPDCHHAICDNCNMLKVYCKKSCSRESIPIINNFTCDDCNSVHTTECKKCGVMVMKTSGCNHIKCKNCESNGDSSHFCYACGFWSEIEDDIYKHMRNEHGDIYSGIPIQTTNVTPVNRTKLVFRECTYYHFI